jgi:hypothetical protein
LARRQTRSGLDWEEIAGAVEDAYVAVAPKTVIRAIEPMRGEADRPGR